MPSNGVLLFVQCHCVHGWLLARLSIAAGGKRGLPSEQSSFRAVQLFIEIDDERVPGQQTNFAAKLLFKFKFDCCKLILRERCAGHFYCVMLFQSIRPLQNIRFQESCSDLSGSPTWTMPLFLCSLNSIESVAQSCSELFVCRLKFRQRRKS